jgi:predicted small lipoprotein YifL
MSKPLALLLAGLSLTGVAACGRKGPLVLPPGRAPLPVAGLKAVAGEGRVDLSWTNPEKEISGRPLGAIGAIEIWVFDQGLPEGVGPLTPDRIETSARLARKIHGRELAALTAVRPGAPVPGVVTFAYVPRTGAAASAKPAFAVRVIDRHGRASEFAGPVEIETTPKHPGSGPGLAGGVS